MGVFINLYAISSVLGTPVSQYEEMRASYNLGSADIVDRFYKSPRDL